MQTVLVVDDEPIVRDVVVRYLQRDGFDTLVAADGDSARELTGGKRLRHVVVGAELEADDAVGLLASRGQHDHRQVAARADPPAQREAVGARQHHVEDDELRRGPLDQLAGGVPVAGDEGVEPVALEVADDDVTHDRLVVDDENGGHRVIVAHGRGAAADFTNRSDLA